MRNSIIALIVLFVASCAKHDGYTITGNVPEAWEGKSVYLSIADASSPYDIDSTVVADGSFKLQGTVDEPRYCHLVIYLDDADRTSPNKIVRTSFFVDNSSIEALYDATAKNPEFKIAGGELEAQYKEVTNKVHTIDKERRNVFADYIAAYYGKKDLPRSFELAKEHTVKQKEMRDVKIHYIKQHPQSVVSLKLASELIERNSDLAQEEIVALFAQLSPQLQNSEMGQSLKEKIDNRKVYIGAPFIDYTLVDAEGNEKKISDFIQPKHTTLVEFWASWCAPCRQEMPYILNTYKEYHNKGLNIVSISIDSDKQSWLKALDEEKLPWGQLLDQKSEAFKEYNLTGVPSSILLDEEGNILLVNARGGWLDAAMQEIYGN